MSPPLPATFAMELQDLLWSHRTAPNVPKTLDAERQITALIAREFAKYEADITALQAEVTKLMDRIEEIEKDHRKWALTNARLYKDERECGQGIFSGGCSQCDYEEGRRIGQVQAGAYHTATELADELRNRGTEKTTETPSGTAGG